MSSKAVVGTLDAARDYVLRSMAVVLMEFAEQVWLRWAQGGTKGWPSR